MIKLFIIAGIIKCTLALLFGSSFASHSLTTQYHKYVGQIQDVSSTRFRYYLAMLDLSRYYIDLKCFTIDNNVVNLDASLNFPTNLFNFRSIDQLYIKVLTGYLIMTTIAQSQTFTFTVNTTTFMVITPPQTAFLKGTYSRKLDIGFYQIQQMKMQIYSNTKSLNPVDLHGLITQSSKINLRLAVGQSRLITLFVDQLKIQIRKTISSTQIGDPSFLTIKQAITLPQVGQNMVCYCLSPKQSQLYILDNDGYLTQIDIYNQTIVDTTYINLVDFQSCFSFKSSAYNYLALVKEVSDSSPNSQFHYFNISSRTLISNSQTLLSASTQVSKNQNKMVQVSATQILFFSINNTYCEAIGKYMDPVTSYCKFCQVSQCKICSNSSDCIECYPGLIFNTYLRICYPCGSGLFQHISTLNCLYCAINCQYCANETFCYQCYTDYLLNELGICTNTTNITETINTTQTTNTTNTTDITNATNTFSYKQQIQIQYLPFNLNEIMKQTLNNSIFQMLNRVPSSRQLFYHIFYFFGNYDDLFLYQFHERDYGNSVNSLFISINALENAKWQIIDGEKRQKIQRFFGINYTDLMNRIDRKKKYSGQNYVQYQGNGENLLSTCWFYLTLNFIFVIIVFILMNSLFKLLYNFRISKLIRPYSFWGYIGVIMIDGNMQIMFYLIFSLSKMLFSFDFQDKILNIISINLLFIFFLASIASFFMYYATYKKLAKYFLNNSQCSISGIMSIVICSTLRQLILSAIHNYFRYDYEKQLPLLAAVQIMHIIVILCFSNHYKSYEKLNGVWISIFFAFLRVIFNVCLYFQQKTINHPQSVDIFDIVLKLFLISYCITYLIGIIWNILEEIIEKLSTIVNSRKQASDNGSGSQQTIIKNIQIGHNFFKKALQKDEVQSYKPQKAPPITQRSLKKQNSQNIKQQKAQVEYYKYIENFKKKKPFFVMSKNNQIAQYYKQQRQINQRIALKRKRLENSNPIKIKMIKGRGKTDLFIINEANNKDEDNIQQQKY